MPGYPTNLASALIVFFVSPLPSQIFVTLSTLQRSCRRILKMASIFLRNTNEFPDQPLLSEDCTLLNCPLTRSIFRYQPLESLAIIPLAFFGLAFLGHLFLGIKYRTWTFTAAAILFCLGKYVFLNHQMVSLINRSGSWGLHSTPSCT